MITLMLINSEQQEKIDQTFMVKFSIIKITD